MATLAIAKILRPANTLKEKVTGGDLNMKIEIDDAVLQRANSAVQELGASFEVDLQSEIASLASLYDGALADKARRAGFLTDVIKRCHEIRGQGGTYGFPLISEFASLLYDFASDPNRIEDVHMEIIKAHIGAIQVVLTARLKNDGGAVGTELKTMLNVAVQKRG